MRSRLLHCGILLTTLLAGCASAVPEPELPIAAHEDPVRAPEPAFDPVEPPTNLEEQREFYDPARITKKPFGIFIDPATSPVQPERFQGYHTGADFELSSGEHAHAVVVSALCDGTVLHTGRVGGYGGVVVQSCFIAGEVVTVLYGHLDPSAITVAVGDTAGSDDPLGRLGAGFSSETDGERPHLHLAVHRGEAVELRGYVQSEAALGAWIDPVVAFSL